MLKKAKNQISFRNKNKLDLNEISSHGALVAVGIVTVNDMLFYGLIKLRNI